MYFEENISGAHTQKQGLSDALHSKLGLYLSGAPQQPALRQLLALKYAGGISMSEN